MLRRMFRGAVGPHMNSPYAMQKLSQLLAIFAMLVLAVLPAGAQTWPHKPLRIIAPYPPGGTSDIVSRYLALKLAPVLGQPVIVENRVGAQGIVGLEAAKNAAPDGYTFVFTNVSNISINPNIYPKLPYDGLKDFAPVTQLGLVTLGMIVSPSLKVKTLPEFIAYAKANPGKVSYGSFGTGSTAHIYGEMLKGAAGIDMVHVPYKGPGPAMQDVVAGHVQMALTDFSAIGAQVRAGNLIVLAVTGPQRWPTAPEVHTFAEQGYPLDVAGWNGIMAPAATPREIVLRMSAEINKIIQSPEGRERMLAMGLIVTGTTPDEFTAVIRRDTPRWGEMIGKTGIKAE